MMGLKPCSNCLRARQRAKGILSALSRRKPSASLEVQCANGKITIDNSTRKIATTPPHMTDLIGTETYVAGAWVFDLPKAEPIYRLGRIVKVTNID